MNLSKIKELDKKSGFSIIKYIDIPKLIENSDIIINTTPLGTYPDIANYPKILYSKLNERHLLFDLIYNPIESQFLRYGKKRNCSIKNGLEMLEIQAESSWKIWNS